MSRFLADLLDFDVTFVPGIPDCHAVPIVFPGNGEMVKAAVLEYLHAIVFYGGLDVVGSCPFA